MAVNNMDANVITTLISSVGFPIVCCCAMAWYIQNTVKELTSVIHNNTIVLEKILTKLDVEE